MTSQVDITKPISGNPTTQSVRDNFTIISAEITSLQNNAGKKLLLSPKTLYVRTDGNDNNDGSANDSAHAFASVQAALTSLLALDLSLNHVTINVADGDYTSFGTVFYSLPYQASPDGYFAVIINGNSSNPSAVKIGSIYMNGGGIQVSNLTVKNTYYGMCFGAFNPTSLAYCENLIFENAYFAAIYTYNGASLSFYNVTGKNCTFGPYAGFVFCQNRSGVEIIGTMTNIACVGKRYYVDGLSFIQTYGAGPDYLPGDASGFSDTGGVYG